ncbi:MAG: STAS domain-containing protein [Chloroflexi bacterium]|nr:STAS domain-containing protein [Chloroflexota bacterium]
MNAQQYDLNDDIRVLILEGRIDIDGAPELEAILRNAIADGKHKLILDMAEVNYLNTEGLHTLAEIQAYSRQHGGEVRLVRLSAIVERVFGIVDFGRYFRDFSTVEAATVGL